MRQLKHHEQRLLKKVDFLDVSLDHLNRFFISSASVVLIIVFFLDRCNLQWKQDSSLREVKVMRRYHIQDREDYVKYNKLCGSLRGLIHRLSLLPAQDPYRARKEGEMLDKLYDMGILG